MSEITTVYTIGHSTKTDDELISKLLDNGIKTLVDVRTIPYSKYNPQFNKEHIVAKCLYAGIRYHWRGKNLGGKNGKKGNVNYDESIVELLVWSMEGKTCIMCSEGDYKKCHRHQMIEPDLLAKEAKVVHIAWSGDNKEVNVDRQTSLL